LLLETRRLIAPAISDASAALHSPASIANAKLARVRAAKLGRARLLRGLAMTTTELAKASCLLVEVVSLPDHRLRIRITLQQAINGWSRWVQPDTLQIGIVRCARSTCADGPGAWCTTADSATDSNAAWVNCQHTGGPGSHGKSEFFGTSFFLLFGGLFAHPEVRLTGRV
jgi:hypothetical protein